MRVKRKRTKETPGKQVERQDTREKSNLYSLSDDTGPSGHGSRLWRGVLNEYGSNSSYAHEKNSISIDDQIDTSVNIVFR